MQFSDEILTLALIGSLWALPWKGLALWKAANNSHKGWFIVILVVNTLAILEIIYLFLIPPRTKITFSWGERKKREEV